MARALLGRLKSRRRCNSIRNFQRNGHHRADHFRQFTFVPFGYWLTGANAADTQLFRKVEGLAGRNSIRRTVTRDMTEERTECAHTCKSFR